MSQDRQPGADGRQAGSEDYAGTPRPDAMMPSLDEGQLAALREIGREWDQLTAGAPPPQINLADHRIRRNQVLSGLTSEYRVAA